jgi:hypothetical protein
MTALMMPGTPLMAVCRHYAIKSAAHKEAFAKTSERMRVDRLKMGD